MRSDLVLVRIIFLKFNFETYFFKFSISLFTENSYILWIGIFWIQELERQEREKERALQESELNEAERFLHFFH